MTTTRGRALAIAFGFTAAVVLEKPLKLLEALGSLDDAPAPAAHLEWLSDDLTPRATEITADSGSALEVTSGTGSYFRLGDIIRSEQTGENMLVTAIQGDSFTVRRELGSNLQTHNEPGNRIVRIASKLWPGEVVGGVAA